MTTIHITIEDSREALSALAAILNLDIGFDIRIDLDEMDDDATAEDIDQLAQAHAWAVGNGVDVGRQKFLDDKLRGLAYALESGDQIAGTAVGSVHYDGPADGTGMYTLLFTNGNSWYGRGDEIVTHVGIEEVDKALHQQRAYDARYAEAQEARVVKCPTCGAKPDDDCVTPAGKPYRSFAHIDRLVKARKSGAK